MQYKRAWRPISHPLFSTQASWAACLHLSTDRVALRSRVRKQWCGQLPERPCRLQQPGEAGRGTETEARLASCAAGAVRSAGHGISAGLAPQLALSQVKGEDKKGGNEEKEKKKKGRN